MWVRLYSCTQIGRAVSDPSILPDLIITWLSPITEFQTTPKPFDITPQTQDPQSLRPSHDTIHCCCCRKTYQENRSIPYPLGFSWSRRNPKSISLLPPLLQPFLLPQQTPLHSPLLLLHTLYPNMSASALLKSRVARPSYLSKLAKAEDLIEHFPHNSWIVSRLKNLR